MHCCLSDPFGLSMDSASDISATEFGHPLSLEEACRSLVLSRELAFFGRPGRGCDFV
jgi:hypothetical protein